MKRGGRGKRSAAEREGAKAGVAKERTARAETAEGAGAAETAGEAKAAKAGAEKRAEGAETKGAAGVKKKAKAQGAKETAKAVGATEGMRADNPPPARELYREGEVPVLDVNIELPRGEELPRGVCAYYRALTEAYARGARERLLPAAREALLALPAERRRFGFRRYRLTVKGRTEVHGDYLLVTRETVLAYGAAVRRREVCEVFRLSSGRLTPPLVFLRDACGKLPRGIRRFRRAEMTLSDGAAILTTARGRTLRVPLPGGMQDGGEKENVNGLFLIF